MSVLTLCLLLLLFPVYSSPFSDLPSSPFPVTFLSITLPPPSSFSSSLSLSPSPCNVFVTSNCCTDHFTPQRPRLQIHRVRPAHPLRPLPVIVIATRQPLPPSSSTFGSSGGRFRLFVTVLCARVRGARPCGGVCGPVSVVEDVICGLVVMAGWLPAHGLCGVKVVDPSVCLLELKLEEVVRSVEGGEVAMARRGQTKNLHNDADVLPPFLFAFFYSYIRLFTISLFISLFTLYFRSLRIFAFGLFESSSLSSFGRGGLGGIGWARFCNVLRATEVLEWVC